MSEIPFPYPKAKVDLARVAARLAAGELHEWAPLKGKAALLWRESAAGFLAGKESAILSAIGSPLGVAEIALAIGYPAKVSFAPLSDHLAGMAMDGKCFAWPGKKKGQTAYGAHSLEDIAGRALLGLAGKSLLKEAQALKGIRLAAPGLDTARAALVLKKLVEGKHLTLFAVKAKEVYLLNPESPEPFVEPLLRRLMESGVTREALLRMIPRDAAEEILSALKEVEPRAEAHYSLTRLREIAGIGHQDFDKACLQLWRDGKVFLHYHDAPQFLSDEARSQLVRDDKGVFYIGISWRG